MPQERRHRRSSHFPRALRLQLLASARRGGFSSLVLTGKTGMVLASAGDEAELDELATVSAKLAPGRRLWQGQYYSPTGVRRISVTPLQCRLGRFYLCALGGDSEASPTSLVHGSHGVARILDRHCGLRAA